MEGSYVHTYKTETSFKRDFSFKLVQSKACTWAQTAKECFHLCHDEDSLFIKFSLVLNLFGMEEGH